MNRRKFITLSSSAASVGILGSSTITHALQQCSQFNFQGVQICDVGIDSQLANISAQRQNFSQWCWAACIEMIFDYYGYYLSQRDIVQQTWGTIKNLPAQPYDIMKNLNRNWTDTDGNRFTVSGDSYSANPITASQDLASDMPLIIGTLGHAMVLTSLTYARDQWGNGEVKSAIVRDPWPGRGRRVLSPQEWYNISFAVRIRVTDN